MSQKGIVARPSALYTYNIILTTIPPNRFYYLYIITKSVNSFDLFINIIIIDL